MAQRTRRDGCRRRPLRPGLVHHLRLATAHPALSPFVTEEAWRSPVTATIEINADVKATDLAAHLRAHEIVDIGAYRGVGTNQLRIGTWPSVEIGDVEALLECIDYCLERVL